LIIRSEIGKLSVVGV